MSSKEIDKIRLKVAAAQYIETSGSDLSMAEAERLISNHLITDNTKDQALEEEFNKTIDKRSYDTAIAVADNYLNGRSGKDGYSNVDETDGSAYISAYMYRSILIREGKWKNEWDEAFNMMEGEDTSWMSDPEKYLKVADLMFGPS